MNIMMIPELGNQLLVQLLHGLFIREEYVQIIQPALSVEYTPNCFADISDNEKAPHEVLLLLNKTLLTTILYHYRRDQFASLQRCLQNRTLHCDLVISDLAIYEMVKETAQPNPNTQAIDEELLWMFVPRIRKALEGLVQFIEMSNNEAFATTLIQIANNVMIYVPVSAIHIYRVELTPQLVPLIMYSPLTPGL